MKSEEIERLKRLYVYEDNLILNGYKKIAGVDEVGRGPLAGPIVAAAVILDRKKILIENLNDSKKHFFKLVPPLNAQFDISRCWLIPNSIHPNT